jgi:hypothetical protein
MFHHWSYIDLMYLSDRIRLGENLLTPAKLSAKGVLLIGDRSFRLRYHKTQKSKSPADNVRKNVRSRDIVRPHFSKG